MNRTKMAGLMTDLALLHPGNRRRPARPAARNAARRTVDRDVLIRAQLRLLWDLLVTVAGSALFGAFMFAPRTVLPGQRIPRPRARRMVQRISHDRAAQLARSTRRVL